MSGSVYGKIFKLATWGESHGKALGVVIDGCPSGIRLCADDFNLDMSRRKPGNSEFTTKRSESDNVEILSGVFNEKTTGTPISLIIYNSDQRSSDYSQISDIYRPGHADYTYSAKYGFRDYRGGGRSSGRETAARVAAGVVAKKLLSALSIEVTAYTTSIAGINIGKSGLSPQKAREGSGKNALCMPDKDAFERAAEFLRENANSGNSYGGIIECVISGVKAGLGEPVFDKLDAALGKAMFSIGAVKGVEIGAGFGAAGMTGSDNNDEMHNHDGKVTKYTNNSGGILGGISDGSDIVLRVAVKPTPSISKKQLTVNTNSKNTTVEIGGRHDMVIVPRAVVVVEAMAAVTIADFVMTSMSSRIDNITSFYEKRED